MSESVLTKNNNIVTPDEADPEAEASYPLSKESWTDVNNFAESFVNSASSEVGTPFYYVYPNASHFYHENVRDALLEGVAARVESEFLTTFEASEHSGLHAMEWSRSYFAKILHNAADLDLTAMQAVHYRQMFTLRNRPGVGIDFNEYEVRDPNYMHPSLAPAIRLIGFSVVNLAVTAPEAPDTSATE